MTPNKTKHRSKKKRSERTFLNEIKLQFSSDCISGSSFIQDVHLKFVSILVWQKWSQFETNVGNFSLTRVGYFRRPVLFCTMVATTRLREIIWANQNFLRLYFIRFFRNKLVPDLFSVSAPKIFRWDQGFAMKWLNILRQ